MPKVLQPLPTGSPARMSLSHHRAHAVLQKSVSSKKKKGNIVWIGSCALRKRQNNKGIEAKNPELEDQWELKE